MGHTLVIRFDKNGNQKLRELMSPFNANKIPFGRNCDREAADAVMDYHLTMFHWPKTRDEYYLECIKNLEPVPCKILITGTRVMLAEEGSYLLYFEASPDQGYWDMAKRIEEKVNAKTSGFLHITLAVSKDAKEIEMINNYICRNVTFPFQLDAEGLDLYHIWTPTAKVRSFYAP